MIDTELEFRLVELIIKNKITFSERANLVLEHILLFVVEIHRH